jgi:hypothetical protein
VKSSRVEPIAGGAGTSPSVERPLTAMIALASRKEVTSKVETRFFFIIWELLIERNHLGNVGKD